MTFQRRLLFGILYITMGMMQLLNHKLNERLQQVKAELKELREGILRKTFEPDVGTACSRENSLQEDGPAPPETSIAESQSKWGR